MRHVGEPLAVVIAESRYIAEDALADIEVELEALPAVVDLEQALAPGATLVHDDLGSNVAAHVRQAKGNYRGGGQAGQPISCAAVSATITARRLRSKPAVWLRNGTGGPVN